MSTAMTDGGDLRKRTNNGHMVVVTVHLPPAFLEFIDRLVEKRIYPNRAEAIRMAVRDFIQNEARGILQHSDRYFE